MIVGKERYFAKVVRLLKAFSSICVADTLWSVHA